MDTCAGGGRLSVMKGTTQHLRMKRGSGLKAVIHTSKSTKEYSLEFLGGRVDYAYLPRALQEPETGYLFSNIAIHIHWTFLGNVKVTEHIQKVVGKISTRQKTKELTHLVRDLHTLTKLL